MLMDSVMYESREVAVVVDGRLSALARHCGCMEG